MDKIENVTVEPMGLSNFVKPLRIHYTQNYFIAVYYNSILESDKINSSIDESKYPGSRGITLEVCAGILDKNEDIYKTVKAEVLEECGYDVPVESFEKIISYRSGVGISGDKQTLFYVEVTDSQKVSKGGGLQSEGEFIEVVEMSIKGVEDLLSSGDINSPGGFLFAIMWFMNKKAHLYKD